MALHKSDLVTLIKMQNILFLTTVQINERTPVSRAGVNIS